MSFWRRGMRLSSVMRPVPWRHMTQGDARKANSWYTELRGPDD